MLKKIRVLSAVLACLAIAAATAGVHSSGHARTLVVTMTNDQNAKQINVYDAESHALLQTLSTHGRGGVGGNARGIKQYDGGLVAAVNNASGNVALFSRDGDALKFDKLIPTTSAPVSVDFGNNHLYVAGATTVDSFVLRDGSVEGLDGTTGLAVAGGGSPAEGETSQVGVISAQQLLVTIKTDPDPGTVDVVVLHRGRITGAAPTAVSAPQGSLAPFGPGNPEPVFALADVRIERPMAVRGGHVRCNLVDGSGGRLKRGPQDDECRSLSGRAA